MPSIAETALEILLREGVHAAHAYLIAAYQRKAAGARS